MNNRLRICYPEADLSSICNRFHTISRTLLLLSLFLLTGCFTDAATHIAYDIEAAAKHVERTDSSKFILAHPTPSKKGECENSYTVQLDKVGALIIWCKNEKKTEIESSHSTSYHSRFVNTPHTYILEKKAKDTLFIELERHGERVVMTGVK
jgi:hypothetical protein